MRLGTRKILPKVRDWQKRGAWEHIDPAGSSEIGTGGAGGIVGDAAGSATKFSNAIYNFGVAFDQANSAGLINNENEPQEMVLDTTYTTENGTKVTTHIVKQDQ